MFVSAYSAFALTTNKLKRKKTEVKQVKSEKNHQKRDKKKSFQLNETVCLRQKKSFYIKIITTIIIAQKNENKIHKKNCLFKAK